MNPDSQQGQEPDKDPYQGREPVKEHFQSQGMTRIQIWIESHFWLQLLPNLQKDPFFIFCDESFIILFFNEGRRARDLSWPTLNV